MELSGNNKQQEIYMNYVKAFAIIAMVIGHTHSPINVYIYQYHMALFMFVSGYFYKDKYTSTPIQLIWKRIKTLYIPFVIYNIVFVILCNVLSLIGVIDKYYNIFKLSELKLFGKSIITFNSYVSYLGGFWFVKTLFFVTIIFVLLSFILHKLKLEKEWIRALIIIIVYVIEWIIIIKKINISKNLIQAPMALPIFYMGYMYSKYRTKIKLGVRGFIVSLLLLIVNSRYGSVDMDALRYTGPIFYLISSVSGIYVNIFIAKLIEQKCKVNEVLNFIGKSTYMILAFHLLTKDIFYRILSKLNVSNNSFLWIADVIIAVSISIGINYVYLKIKKNVKSHLIKRQG